MIGETKASSWNGPKKLLPAVSDWSSASATSSTIRRMTKVS